MHAWKESSTSKSKMCSSPDGFTGGYASPSCLPSVFSLSALRWPSEQCHTLTTQTKELMEHRSHNTSGCSTCHKRLPPPSCPISSHCCSLLPPYIPLHLDLRLSQTPFPPNPPLPRLFLLLILPVLFWGSTVATEL